MDAGTLRRALAGLRDDAVVSVSASVRLPGGHEVVAGGGVDAIEVTENPALAMQWVTLGASCDLSADGWAHVALGLVTEAEWEEETMGG